jgi:hypothetical protein
MAIKIVTDRERIKETDYLATAFNRDRLGTSMSRRIVVLECGHRAITRNAGSMICPRCTEMLRRSIETGEEDYETFRRGNMKDEMVWPSDPCRVFNEPTDLGGNFRNGEA